MVRLPLPIPQSAATEEPDFWQEFEAAEVEEVGVSSTPGPLTQLEAKLGHSSCDEPVPAMRAPVPAPNDPIFSEPIATVSPPTTASERFSPFLNREFWRVGARVQSDRLRQSLRIQRLSESSRWLGQHRVLTGIALFLTAALVAYLAAGGMQQMGKQTSASPKNDATPAIVAQTMKRPGALVAEHEPPPPAEGPNTADSPLPSNAEPSPNANSNRKVAHTHGSRHRVTAFDKARAFFRRLF